MYIFKFDREHSYDMNNHTSVINNHDANDSHEIYNGPSFYSRITFASAWIIIAVAGIIGKKNFSVENFSRSSI